MLNCLLYILQVVQKGIGHSLQYITTAFAYSDLKMISDMKDTPKQFKILPKEFGGNMFGLLLVLQHEL